MDKDRNNKFKSNEILTTIGCSFIATVFAFMIITIISAFAKQPLSEIESIVEHLTTKVIYLPVENHVLDDLCIQFGVSKESFPCKHDEIVQERELYSFLIRSVDEGSLNTYDEWQSKLGVYLLYCGNSRIEREKEYFQCFYDFENKLEEDRYKIMVYFYSDGEFWKMRETVGK